LGGRCQCQRQLWHVALRRFSQIRIVLKSPETEADVETCGSALTRRNTPLRDLPPSIGRADSLMAKSWGTSPHNHLFCWPQPPSIHQRLVTPCYRVVTTRQPCTGVRVAPRGAETKAAHSSGDPRPYCSWRRVALPAGWRRDDSGGSAAGNNPGATGCRYTPQGRYGGEGPGHAYGRSDPARHSAQTSTTSGPVVPPSLIPRALVHDCEHRQWYAAVHGGL
jgi:hypothetical protein